jgi:hypothetical protein
MTDDDPLARYDLRDTQRLIKQIAAIEPLHEGVVLLALVHQPAAAQRLLAVRKLSPLPPVVDEHWGGRSELLADAVRQFPIPRRSRESASIVVTVIVRRGFNGWGPEEKRWMSAWRYSNHCTNAFDRDIIVVTEHGWCSLWSEAGGHEPALVERPPTLRG